MTDTKDKVCVALSGGVDSSTAAALLLEQGYECFGVFMISCDQHLDSVSRVEEIARQLDIKLEVLDMRAEFEQILEYFCSQYRQGRTPNPCVYCNRIIKFGRLWEFAKSKGAKFMATGHYARLLRDAQGNIGLFAADSPKDQSYALAMIKSEMLQSLILPLGEFTKDRTRQVAQQLGLSSAKKEESQEICFIPDNNYVRVLEERAPELMRKGKIIDKTGKVLGEHNGIHRFTIGQRRGLRIAMGRPYYVIGLDAATNTVIIGPKEELYHRRLKASQANWLIDRPDRPFRAKVKIRYNDSGRYAIVRPQADEFEVEFEQPAAAITPGQLAAVYIEQDGKYRLAGGAWIDTACE